MFHILSAVDRSRTYTCGNLDITFQGTIPFVISMVITMIQIVIPILLVIFGMIDMGKAVMAQKEDEIKKGQQTLIKRIIAAVIVFFVVTIVKMVIGFLANDDANIVNCLNCFIDAEVANDACRVAGGAGGTGM